MTEAMRGLEAEVVALLEQAQTATVGSGETDEQQQVNQSTTATYAAAVESWDGKQALEVDAGSRPVAAWTAYGRSIKKNLQEWLALLDGSSGWWRRLLTAVGAGADTAVSALEARVSALQDELSTINRLRLVVIQRSNLLSDQQDALSDETRESLYGASWDATESEWETLKDAASALADVVGRLRSGSAALESTGDGELQAVALSGLQRGLGAAPVVIAIGIVAAVALAWAVAYSLKAKYAHADEVSRAEVAALELNLVAQGKGAEVTQLRQLRNAADAARPPDPLAMAGKVVAGAVLLAGGLWGVSKLFDVLMRRRSQREAA